MKPSGRIQPEVIVNIFKPRMRLVFLGFGFLLALNSIAHGQAEANSNSAKLRQKRQSPSKTRADKMPSQVLISENAETLGFNPKKLQAIDRKLSALVKGKKVFGCSALIYRKGEEVYFGKWGYQDQAQQTVLQRDTIFRIYSMSKPITSIAAMQLAEQGKIDIDSPITEYLPEFANLKVLENQRGKSVEVEPKRKMTTRDLLRHTSGLAYGVIGNTPIDKRYRKAGVLITDLSIKSTVNKLSAIPLLYHPATQFHYSASTDVLGRVVEVASEKKFDEYLSENVFKRLKMDDTFFTVPTEKLGRLAELYRPNSKGELVPANPIQSYRFKSQSNQFFSGGGGLCSTVDDYLAFCKMLLNEGKFGDQQIVKPNTIQQMFKNQLGKIERSPGRQFKFGLGFRVFPQGDYGWGGAAGTRFWVHPDKEMAIVFMMQIMPNSKRKYGELVRDIAYGAMR